MTRLEGWTIEDEQCQKIGGGYKAGNRPVVAVLTCSMGRSVGEKCPHKKYVDTYAKCVGVAGAMFQGSRSAMQFTG